MDAKKIGKRLTRLRGDMSQAEVAKKCKIARSTLGMYENGLRVPRDEIKVRLAKFYKKSVGDIFFTSNVTKSRGT